MREKGKRTRKRGQWYLSWRTKDCLWMERRQMWSIGNWQFIKVQEETPSQEEVFDLKWAY
jgi:hypothetical protein